MTDQTTLREVWVFEGRVANVSWADWSAELVRLGGDRYGPGGVIEQCGEESWRVFSTTTATRPRTRWMRMQAMADSKNTDRSQSTRWRLASQFAVPGTSRQSAYKNWLRCPRNASIKRAMLSVMDTLRGVTVPPNNWDDIPRSTERSWKRHRRTRWREPVA